MDIIAQHNVIATKLYGAETNEYYKDPAKRIVSVTVSRNVDNLYRVTAITLSNHNNVYASPVFSTWQEAREDANRVWLFVRDVLHGQMREDGAGRVPGNTYKVTHCPKCDRFNTLKTKQESYGDRTTCAACDYHNYYSIGD